MLTDITKLYRHPTPNTNNMTPDDITALGEIKSNQLTKVAKW